jgi:hypothetical protein
MTVKKEARKEDAKEQRRIRNRNRGTGIDGADWGEADAGLIAQAIAAITKAKCAVQFGLTRDGGAYVIRIVGDGEPYNEFCRPTEDIDLYLRGLIEDFESVG